MQKRLQQTEEDTVLEIVETKEVKTRYSEKELLRRRAAFVRAIAQCQAQIDEVDKALDMIRTEKDAQK